jgi:hypothetical protein
MAVECLFSMTLLPGRKAMYSANYGKAAELEARKFDFGELFGRCAAVSRRSDLPDMFREFSVNGDGRLDQCGRACKLTLG